jgi:hypothetical protein
MSSSLLALLTRLVPVATPTSPALKEPAFAPTLEPNTFLPRLEVSSCKAEEISA